VIKCGCYSHDGFLTVRGYAEVAQRERQLYLFPETGLTQDGKCVRLDKSSRVTASSPVELHWDDEVIEEQYRRFHNGS